MPRPATAQLPALLREVRSCTLCAAHLADGVRPILQVAAGARILVAGQAPGRKVHASGLPFDDASGARLRNWMGVDASVFYDPAQVAILPMGFCYPGTGKSGDLPPRKECAPQWRAPLLAAMPQLELLLVIGQYAIDWHLPQKAGATLTETVRNWRKHWPQLLPLPHPSPRNNIWLKANPWFEQEVVPALQARVATVLGRHAL
ncbi:uracil-DNA glycosylase family protein [Paucibacter sp. TC2R-5]|uniref:uracil-DNA glycosylase family protein n=1 Tax=Paucibacter sp. TC2R-5 TaxID=2893555 RepID=UPI0021E3E159|nr:uracil-DNA glycosylase family protein [Paucibacter sp. TC2R-5]MCV2359306.1 uracil-DNA glycosylase family protein [Paucibacter sp. TC2R-5]